MNILVLNGSPKGNNSITLQTVLYLKQRHKEHAFDILNVGASIRSFEKDFAKAKTLLEKADLILFSYPVYTFIVPCQLHRFIELIKESGVDLSGKFATQISTSKHFYDVTAHTFIEENCKDMKMKYIKGLSADMDDLTKAKGRKEAKEFFNYVCWCIEKDIYEAIPEEAVKYKPKPVTVPEGEEKEKAGDIVIVADLKEEDVQPSNFLDVGGMKIFRDLIWQMQGLMRADHKFYKSHGQYDFPQKKWPVMLAMYLVGGMMSNKKLMQKAGSKMNEGMLMPYRKVMDKD